MNIFKRMMLLMHERTIKEIAPSYDRDASPVPTLQAIDEAYKAIDEMIQPWLSPLEAKQVHDALYDIIYRIDTGDSQVEIRKRSDDRAVASMLDNIDLGDD